MPVPNKSFAFMAADVNALTPVPRKNYGDYPQHSEFKSATIASGKTLVVIEKAAIIQMKATLLKAGKTK